MDTLGLQLERNTSGTVVAGANVVFEDVISSFGAIAYDTTTGIITINKAGRFFVNWWVATQSSLGTQGASFSIVTSQGDALPGDSPLKNGEVVGFALFQVEAAPVTVSLENTTSNTVIYSLTTPTTASLVLGEVLEEDTGVTGATGT
ncbi:hypothetical protein SAMN02745170_02246, partial [Propionispora hippei DSM 15287]